MATFVNAEPKPWDLTNGEKYAIKWFREHDFDVVLKRRTVTADTFSVSKGELSTKFRLPLGDAKIRYRKVMEQFEKDWELLEKLAAKEQSEQSAEVFETPMGEVLCGRCGHELECNDCGDMPDVCPECGVKLNYSFYETEGES